MKRKVPVFVISDFSNDIPESPDRSDMFEDSKLTAGTIYISGIKHPHLYLKFISGDSGEREKFSKKKVKVFWNREPG